MKKIMTFLVAGLIIVSALAINACKKTDTNTNAEDWTPTTYVVMDARDSDTVTCVYCGAKLGKCHEILEYVDKCFYCPTHSHVHWFSVTDTCVIEDQTGDCDYQFVREHKHVITPSAVQGFYWHSFHVGGSGGGGH